MKPGVQAPEGVWREGGGGWGLNLEEIEHLRTGAGGGPLQGE